MSQTSPFGQPADDESSQRPPVPTTPAPAEKSSRTALLAIGATAIALVAGVGGFFLLSGGSDEYPTGVASNFPQSSASASTPTPSTSPTPLPTESTVNARNPFLNPPSPKASATATSPTAVATAPTTPVANTPAPTVTVEKTEVFVTLVKFNPDNGDATFKVISPKERGQKGWPVSVSDDFGTPWGKAKAKPFTYDGVFVKGSGTLCASVKYVDAASVRVCQGEIVQVQ
jgi:hypothetical protein